MTTFSHYTRKLEWIHFCNKGKSPIPLLFFNEKGIVVRITLNKKKREKEFTDKIETNK